MLDEENNLPGFKTVLATDTGVASILYIPLVIVIPAFIVLWLSDDFTMEVEDALQLAAIVFSFYILVSPFVLWWYVVIRRTFSKNITCNGTIVSVGHMFPFHTELTVKIQCDELMLDRTISYINTRRVKAAVLGKTITILTNKKKNMFFVKEAFVD